MHDLRSRVGAIIVGTGTVLVDDPLLTVRRPAVRSPTPPLRVVVGSRPIPAGARVLDDSAPTLLTGERDPDVLLADLYGRGVRHALLEGRPDPGRRLPRRPASSTASSGTSPRSSSAPDRWRFPRRSRGAARWESTCEAVDVVGEDVRVVGRVRYEEAGA